MTITADQAQSFENDGFLVLDGFIDPSRCGELRDRANELEDQLRSEMREHTVFSTTDQSHGADSWFMESGDKIRGFFEADSDRLNKIGHAMHDLDPVFDSFARDTGLEEVASAIGMAEPKLVQSMYIYKHPGVGGEVTWHTDHTFLWTEPQSVVGFWVAIDDATTENGCLWAVPGGHKIAVKSRFLRNEDNITASTEIYDDTPYPIDDAVALEARSGTLVVLHGNLPHWSDTNHSAHPRQAFTLHVVDGVAHWDQRNWLRRADGFAFRGF